jgi:hypothetical protein
LAGTRSHPLVQLFDQYIRKTQDEFEDSHQQKATDGDLHGLAQHFSFPVPILSSNDSLIEDFLADIGFQFRKEAELAVLSLHLQYVEPILFRLVILQVYLRRPPENDHNIFELVKENRVSQIWTSHEQALAACHGEENTSHNSPLAHPPALPLYKIAVIDDSGLVISDDEPLITIRSLQSVRWALSGGL